MGDHLKKVKSGDPPSLKLRRTGPLKIPAATFNTPARRRVRRSLDEDGSLGEGGFIDAARDFAVRRSPQAWRQPAGRLKPAGVGCRFGRRIGRGKCRRRASGLSGRDDIADKLIRKQHGRVSERLKEPVLKTITATLRKSWLFHHLFALQEFT